MTRLIRVTSVSVLDPVGSPGSGVEISSVYVEILEQNFAGVLNIRHISDD